MTGTDTILQGYSEWFQEALAETAASAGLGNVFGGMGGGLGSVIGMLNGGRGMGSTGGLFGRILGGRF